ncbi:hypothetical protein IMZ08_01505 [Bacillus luteolus]|uniref:DUF2524 family protein n=1 Tax=Litchfieldia luteola TaxID=682179 RepID=A0ABR9QE00_9BACI|nr:hypothetical protein [Cytobacillus luteolus]MBE4906731.1 hypothetical protein [Cytobacillus luteolus]MBP1940619.1 hypothetical protein [Cytobacillus luteolus]
MDEQNTFEKAMNSLELAEKELIDAQTTGDAGELNQAHYQLQITKDLLNSLDESGLSNEQQLVRLNHAKEHLRHLLETEISLQ